MNDTAPEVSTQKKRNLALPIAAGVVAVAAGGFLVSRAGLDKALVKEQVDAFIVNAQNKAKESGRDLAISYKDIEIEGGFTNRHAVLKEPTLTVKPLGANTPVSAEGNKLSSSMVVTTRQIDIFPESADLSSLRIEAPAPLQFADTANPEVALMTITSNSAPSVSVSQTKQGEVAYSNVTYRAPTETEIKYLKETQATGEEDKTPTLTPVFESLKMTMAQGSGFSFNLAQDKSGLGKASISIADLAIVPSAAPDSALKAPLIKGEWQNLLNEKKRNVVKATLQAGPITSANAALPYQPVTITFDGAFDGVIPTTPGAASVAGTAEPSVLSLKTFKIETKDSIFSASADFTAAATDTMPVGKASISLTNLPYVMSELKKSGALDEKGEAIVLALAQKITGAPTEQLADLNFTIERVKDGQFKVGSTSFEELFATMISQSMQKQEPAAGAPETAEPPHVPQLPPADKPKAAPIEVPAQGDRG